MQFLSLPYLAHLSCISSGKLVAPHGWQHASRDIDSFVLLQGLQGKVFIQQGDTKYELSPGYMMLLLPGVRHFGFQPSADDSSYYWCHFSFEGAVNIAGLPDLYRSISRHNAGSKNTNIYLPVFFKLQNEERVSILFRQLIHVQKSSHYAHFHTDYCLSSVVSEITEQVFQYFSPFAGQTVSSRFDTALEWVRINYDQQVSVGEIARRFNYNANYFSRIFKENVGLPLGKYINHLRIEKARQLLVDTDLSIKEIACDVGINDEKNFMKLFRKIENLTPTQYRNAFSYSHLNNR